MKKPAARPKSYVRALVARRCSRIAQCRLFQQVVPEVRVKLIAPGCVVVLQGAIHDQIGPSVGDIDEWVIDERRGSSRRYYMRFEGAGYVRPLREKDGTLAYARLLLSQAEEASKASLSAEVTP